MIAIFIGSVVFLLLMAASAIISVKGSRSFIFSIFMLILIFSMQKIFAFVKYEYSEISLAWFNRTANGQVPLSMSPLKVPKDQNSNKYCDQFRYENGRPIIISTHINANEEYCGAFAIYVKKSPILSFKLLPNKKAIYWVGSGETIIGPSPH